MNSTLATLTKFLDKFIDASLHVGAKSCAETHAICAAYSPPTHHWGRLPVSSSRWPCCCDNICVLEGAMKNETGLLFAPSWLQSLVYFPVSITPLVHWVLSYYRLSVTHSFNQTANHRDDWIQNHYAPQSGRVRHVTWVFGKPGTVTEIGSIVDSSFRMNIRHWQHTYDLDPSGSAISRWYSWRQLVYWTGKSVMRVTVWVTWVRVRVGLNTQPVLRGHLQTEHMQVSVFELQARTLRA